MDLVTIKQFFFKPKPNFTNLPDYLPPRIGNLFQWIHWDTIHLAQEDMLSNEPEGKNRTES